MRLSRTCFDRFLAFMMLYAWVCSLKTNVTWHNNCVRVNIIHLTVGPSMVSFLNSRCECLCNHLQYLCKTVLHVFSLRLDSSPGCNSYPQAYNVLALVCRGVCINSSFTGTWLMAWLLDNILHHARDFRREERALSGTSVTRRWYFLSVAILNVQEKCL